MADNRIVIDVNQPTRPSGSPQDSAEAKAAISDARRLRDDLELKRRELRAAVNDKTELIKQKARDEAAEKRRQYEIDRYKIQKEFKPKLKAAVGEEAKEKVKDERKAEYTAAMKKRDDALNEISTRRGKELRNEYLQFTGAVHDAGKNFKADIEKAVGIEKDERKKFAQNQKNWNAAVKEQARALSRGVRRFNSEETQDKNAVRRNAIREQVRAIRRMRNRLKQDDAQAKKDKQKAIQSQVKAIRRMQARIKGTKAYFSRRRRVMRKRRGRQRQFAARQQRQQASASQQAARAAAQRQQRANLIGRAVTAGVIRAIGGPTAGRLGALGQLAGAAAAGLGGGALATGLGVVGVGLTGTAIAVGLATLPERLQKSMRAMSEGFGGPSQGQIERVSPEAALARARQRQAAAFGAIDAAGISGKALGRRIEAETRLATALNQAQARLFAATEPIWTGVLNIGADALEGLTGANGSANTDIFKTRLNAASALSGPLASAIARPIFDWLTSAQWERDHKPTLDRWIRASNAQLDRQKATQRGIYPFTDEMLKPFEFAEFVTGTPDPNNPGFNTPPEWAQPSDMDFD